MRTVPNHRRDWPSLWAAVESIAPKIGCIPQTLLEWVKRHKVDSGLRAGVITVGAFRVKARDREVNDLRRADGLDKAELMYRRAPCGTKEALERAILE